MRIVFSHITAEYQVYIAEKLPQVSLQVEQEILHPQEQDIYAAFGQERKREFVSVRKLLRYIFPQKNLLIVYTKSGKPTLTDAYISISHSKQYVAIMYSTIHAVALDIEQYRPSILHIASRFVNVHEQKLFSSLPDITLLWSAKETAYKLYELSPNFKEDYTISSEQDISDAGLLIGKLSQKEIDIHIKINYFRTQDFCLTWCFASNM